MTAEIAIMNKNAVALAADSAVTLRNPDSEKIYNTANKLFMLSKYHPVGVMVYGPAELMGIPWETAIKMCRAQLATQNFDHVIEFAKYFFEFLENNDLLYPLHLQKAEFSAMCTWVLSQIKQKIDELVKTQIESTGGIGDDRIAAIITDVVKAELQSWQQLRRLDCFDPKFETELSTNFSDCVAQVLVDVFGRLPIERVRDQLLEICVCRVTKEWWSMKSGGVVIAGFGRKDFLPVLHSFTVESIINSRLKQDRLPFLSNDMGESRSATIIPFAQAEIVHRFIRGIDPDYKREFMNLIRQLLTVEYPEKLVAAFADRTTEDERRNVQAELIRIARAVIDTFDDKWSGWEHGKFVQPVIDIVGNLPKDDLAAMAESLVNLTSFKRRITAEAETVGGPIDVAVISKGDGFVWIKRKHYFQRDLNPAFFANYYRRDEDGV